MEHRHRAFHKFNDGLIGAALDACPNQSFRLGMKQDFYLDVLPQATQCGHLMDTVRRLRSYEGWR
jgi:hypothetical protein